ncbi:MAG: UbiD family decarboxylase, partial [Dehalococcoidia bacterium]|nr:UbiD family decarboxylase [Dehalococcoidia bacterium]
VHNKEEVDLRGDVAAIARKLTKMEGPAVLHENIRGYPGWRILNNSLNSAQKVGWATGLEPQSLVRDLAGKMGHSVPPMQVASGPCKELKFFGDDVDLFKIPVPFSGEYEGTPNFTAGFSNVVDPETGWQNVAVRRFGLKGKNVLSEMINQAQQDVLIWGKYTMLGKQMPCAIVVGADPMTYMCALTKAPVGYCEYELWGVLTGTPLEVVKCETSDIVVPASAELVIEGYLDSKDRELDGPFPEFLGYYTQLTRVAKFHATCITMRKDPIFWYFHEGWGNTEGDFAAHFAMTAGLYRELINKVPGIINVWTNPFTSGVGTIVQVAKAVAKTYPGIARQIAGVASSVSPLQKYVWVIDEDVEDPTNLNDMLYALVNKFQASKDVQIWSRGVGCMQNPAELWAGQWGWDDTIVLDCTEKPPPYDEGYRRGKALPPADATEKVERNWTKYGFPAA